MPMPEPARVSPSPAMPKPELRAPRMPEVDTAWMLTMADVLLQLEHIPTSGLNGTSCIPERAFGRVPAFTLYRDGTILFADDSPDGDAFLFYRLSQSDTAETLRHVEKLGMGRLSSHLEHCVTVGRRRSCVSHATIRALRARFPDGTRREIWNYNGYVVKGSVELRAIYDRIAVLSAPRWRQQIWLYRPHAATLSVVPHWRDPKKMTTEERADARPWPLAAEILAPALAARVIVLDGPQIEAMIAATGTNLIDDQLFALDDRFVRVSMIPWLPAVDHRAAIARAAAGEAVPCVMSGCVTRELPPHIKKSLGPAFR